MSPNFQQSTPMLQIPSEFVACQSDLPLGENYGYAAAPGPIRPTRLAVERFNESFTRVVGRLSLLGNTKKYDVPVGEVNRRINGPEKVHASMLNGLMRNGKGKENCEILRAKLSEYGIEVPYGRRKACSAASFGALCEGESRELAKEFVQMCHQQGEADVIGKEYLEEQMNQRVRCSTVAFDMMAVGKFLKFITRVHPSGLEPGELDSTSPVEKGVEKLSLLTHGFSHVAISGVANYFGKITSEVTKILHQGSDAPGPKQIPRAIKLLGPQHPLRSSPSPTAGLLTPPETPSANSPNPTFQSWYSPPTIQYPTGYAPSSPLWPQYAPPAQFMYSNFGESQSQVNK